jgi:hypothetical protein
MESPTVTIDPSSIQPIAAAPPSSSAPVTIDPASIQPIGATPSAAAPVTIDPASIQPIDPSAQSAPESVWQHIKDFATHPLVDARQSPEFMIPNLLERAGTEYLEKTGHPTLAKVSSALTGVREAETDIVSSMSSPLNLGMMLATGGLGAMKGVAGPVVARLANLGFSGLSLYRAYQNFPAIRQALQAGDVETAAKLMTENAANIGMAAQAGLHSLGEVNPEISKAPAAKIVENDAVKTETERPFTNPFQPKGNPAVRTNTGEQVPVAKVVPDDHVPVVSKDEILSEGAQRILNNADQLKTILDPTKLNTAADINSALNQAADVIDRNLDPRVGTRIGLDAQKGLASDLGMTLDELANRKSGEAFSAEQAIAARGLLKSSTDNVLDLARKAATGDEASKNELAFAVARHQEIQNAVAGVTSEAGRALGSFRIGADDLPEVKIASAMSQLPPEALGEATKLLAKLDPNDPNYVRKANAFIQEITPSSTGAKLFEVYRNLLLSGPQTVIKKTASEVSMMALEATKKFVVGTAEWARSNAGISAKPEAFPSEAWWYAKGAVQALTHAPDVLTDKFTLADSPDFEHNFEKAIKGTPGKIINAPSELLSRMTNVVFTMNYFGELNSLAARQAVSEGLSGEKLAARQEYLAQNPTPKMTAAANQQGLYGTFQGKLGETGTKFSGAIRSNPVLRFLFPFFRTPVNLIKASGDYSPYGLFKGTAQGDLNLQAKGLIGSSIAAGVAYLALNNIVTGGGPVNFGQRETKEATGWQPYSVKIGNKYYSYHKNEPLGVVLSGVADIVHGIAHNEDPATTQMSAANIVNHISRNVEDFPFLMQISSLVDGLTHLGTGHTAERIVDNLLGSAVVPAGVKDIAQGTDPTMRSPGYEGLANPVPGLAQTIESRVPGLTKNVPPDIDVTGQPVQRPTSALGGANPFPVTTAKPNPVVDELARLGTPAITAPTTLNIYVNGKKTQIPVSPDEGKQMAQKEQQAFYTLISEHILDPSWVDLSDAGKKKVIARMRAAVRSVTQQQYLQSHQPAGVTQ